MFVYAPTVGSFYSITGVMTWTFSERKIEPRILTDIEVGSGINETNATLFGVYPNPANDVVRLDLPNVNGQRVEYSIVDAAGRTVMNGTLTSNVLTVDALANGTYTLTISSAAGVSQARVLVQR